MTAAQLRAQLSFIEANERMYEGINSGDIPALKELLADKNDWMAARAVFALSRLQTDESLAELANAAGDGRPAVRVAVAAAVSQRPVALPDAVLIHLLEDRDPGVRKFAAKAVKPENAAATRDTLNRLAEQDQFPVIRQNAVEALRRIQR